LPVFIYLLQRVYMTFSFFLSSYMYAQFKKIAICDQMAFFISI